MSAALKCLPMQCWLNNPLIIKVHMIPKVHIQHGYIAVWREAWCQICDGFQRDFLTHVVAGRILQYVTGCVCDAWHHICMTVLKLVGIHHCYHVEKCQLSHLFRHEVFEASCGASAPLPKHWTFILQKCGLCVGHVSCFTRSVCAQQATSCNLYGRDAFIQQSVSANSLSLLFVLSVTTLLMVVVVHPQNNCLWDSWFAAATHFHTTQPNGQTLVFVWYFKDRGCSKHQKANGVLDVFGNLNISLWVHPTCCHNHTFWSKLENSFWG